MCLFIMWLIIASHNFSPPAVQRERRRLASETTRPAASIFKLAAGRQFLAQSSRRTHVCTRASHNRFGHPNVPKCLWNPSSCVIQRICAKSEQEKLKKVCAIFISMNKRITKCFVITLRPTNIHSHWPTTNNGMESVLILN